MGMWRKEVGEKQITALAADVAKGVRWGCGVGLCCC